MSHDGTNPIFPTSYEMTITFIGALIVALTLYCVFTIYRNPHIDAVQKLLWLVLVLVLPLIGPIAWIYYSSTLRLAHRAKTRTSSSPSAQ